MTSSWGERMASVVTACGPRTTTHLPYHRRLEKVKFGVPLDQVCKRDIPGPLLVMLLKINKEGPYKKHVFRAPGHAGNTRKLIHFLQQGRLVNISQFSVNTIASVLKKFLRKIPGGIFGPANEALLFSIQDLDNEADKLAIVQRVFSSLPIYSQHLLVLLIGTFRLIHSHAENHKTGMTAEALGVSVAPSFFLSISEGKTAKPEEVQKFTLAPKITTFFIRHFGMRDLFTRENYEYYARITGRILKVEDEWIFFTYPIVIYGENNPDSGMMAQNETTSLKGVEDDHQMATIEKSGSLEIIPESHSLLDPNGRLSISLDDKNLSSPESPTILSRIPENKIHMTTNDPNYCLPQWDVNRRHTAPAKRRSAPPGNWIAAEPGNPVVKVHQRQTERMLHRSEWFLSDPSGMVTVKCRPTSTVASTTSSSTLRPTTAAASSTICDKKLQMLSISSLGTLPKSSLPSAPRGQQTVSSGPQPDVRLRRRLSDKDNKERRLVRRSSSKRKDKENGAAGKSGNPEMRHNLLCRTASEDDKNNQPPDSGNIKEAGLNRSLPRI